MAGKISSSAAGVQAHDGSRATAKISTNTRVRTTTGFVGLVTDAMTFPDATGIWTMPNQRVRVNNIPTIGSSSIGTSVSVDTSTGTMIVAQGDGRVDAM